MHRSHQLLHLLADGRFRSGAALGKELGVGRSMVWKLVKSLEGLGLDIHAVGGRGYRLADPLELLDEFRITTQLDAESGSLLSGLDIHFDIDSTNRYLMHKASREAPSGWACLAETQTAGRGRRGREWLSPFAGNIYLSLLWRFNPAPPSLGSMGLVMGVAVIRALEDMGVKGVSLKWPNDVLADGKKLAGVLIEMAGDPTGECYVVIGVGLNVRMPQRSGNKIDQAWVDVATLMENSVSRNQLAGRLLHHLLLITRQFETEGFAPFLPEWREKDMMYQQPVTVHLANKIEHGISQGIDEDGALLVEQGGRINKYHAGDVSLRLDSEAIDDPVA